MDFKKLEQEDRLRKKVDRLYSYLKAKYIRDKDSYKMQMLDKQDIRRKILSGASEIDGVSLGSNDNRMGVDVYDYAFQLDWERENYE